MIAEDGVGESMRALAKEYKVTEGTIRHRVNTHLKPMLDVAKQLAEAELVKEAFSIITQGKIRSLTDELIGMIAEDGVLFYHKGIITYIIKYICA
jgi:hypothetical protein